MSEVKTPTPTTHTPSVSELVTQIKAKANSWCEGFSGKTNYNPHLDVAKHIKPLLDELAIKGATVTPAILAKVHALPLHPAAINPNYVPEVTGFGKPLATAASVGELNAKVS